VLYDVLSYLLMSIVTVMDLRYYDVGLSVSTGRGSALV
jgi:hypothetical protein